MKKPAFTGFFVATLPEGALVYGILQAFASLKARHITGRNLNGFTGSWVATCASRAGLYRECSKANERYRTAIGKRSSDAVEHCVNRFGCIRA